MKLDFEYLDRVRQHLQFQSKLDPEEYANGQYIYEIRFSPSKGECEVHMQWPMLRNLIVNEGADPVEVDCMGRGTNHASLHITGKVRGIEIRTCLDKSEVLDDLDAVLAEHPCDDVKYSQDDDIESLFNLWRDLTGWNRERTV